MRLMSRVHVEMRDGRAASHRYDNCHQSLGIMILAVFRSLNIRSPSRHASGKIGYSHASISKHEIINYRRLYATAINRAAALLVGKFQDNHQVLTSI